MGRLVVVLVMVAVAAGPASADPAAEKLFRDGQAAMAQGATEKACDLFARSQALEPRAGTALNLGNCLEQLGKTASAWEAFMAAKSLATSARDKGKGGEANRRASALLPGLAYLTIVVPADLVDGFALSHNSDVVERAVWNVAVPVDPGSHVVVATAPGHRDWSETRPVGGGEHATITVGALEPIAAPAVVVATTPPPTAPPLDGAATHPVDAAPSVTATATPVPRAPRRWAIGVTVGESTGLDPTFGLRLFRDIPVGKGAMRAMVSAIYDNFNDDNTNGFMRSHQVLFGGSAEYTWSSSQLRFAVGVTTGLDLLFRNSDRGTHAAPWWGIRFSPVIVRALDTLEIGLHLQGIQSTDRLAAFGLVAVDWYVR